MESVNSKNFGLSEAQFKTMSAKLREGDESFFERIYIEHFDDCKNYLIRRLNATKDEGYDATMQTLLNFRRSIILQKIQYGNLKFLFTKMAYYQVLKKRNKSKINKSKDLEYYQLAKTIVSTQEKPIFNALKTALESLNDGQRELLTKHYYHEIKLQDIAKSIGVPDSTLRKRKERIINTLRLKLKSTKK